MSLPTCGINLLPYWRRTNTSAAGWRRANADETGVKMFRMQHVLLVVVAAVLGCLSPIQECHAQKKYKGPDDPRVKEVCDRAVDYLRNMRAGAIGPRTVGALAVVEYGKRYDGVPPTDDPFVQSVCDQLAEMVDGNGREIYDNKETYFPALALILLAEYDSKKYKDQCVKILGALLDRQLDNGAFTYRSDSVGDTSQSQFGALAFYVARQHRLPLDPKDAARLLQFYVDYQAQSGTWAYKASLGGRNIGGSNSIHSASLSSVYLLADMLKLSKRVKNMASTSANSSLGLPKNVTVYIPPKDNEQARIQEAWDSGDGPVVKFERGKLASCKSAGNQWYTAKYRFPADQWNSYFLYALERYCYFKEQAEGGVGSSLKAWYDNGVDFIIEYQKDDGSIDGKGRTQTMPVPAATGLYVLFMVRASEIISLPPVDSELEGFDKIPEGPITQGKNGVIVSTQAEKSLQDLIANLSDATLDERQLKQMTEAMKRSIREFKQTGEKSRGEITAFLKTMISEKNYYRRLIAIRFLAGEQDMDNVPALLYAMGDPDPSIAIQAHNGLRLISRKFDTFVFEDRGNKEDNLLSLARLKQQWTKWYLEIRPDAELLE